MTILADWEIEDQCRDENNQMIWPFVPHQVRYHNTEKVISYGLTSFGYDMRAAAEWKLCHNALDFDTPSYLDPKRPDDRLWTNTIYADSIIIPAHGFCLTRSVEYFRIPEHVMCVVVGKSTYARLGLIVNVTPLEPGWAGHVTIELTNSTPMPIRVYGNEGIAQVLFHDSAVRPSITYADRDGKYQNQQGIVMARI